MRKHLPYKYLIVKAFLCAAGLGTRLKPLTDDRPKALVELHGKPLVEIALRRLAAAGVREVVVNVHHFADKLESFIKSQDFGLTVHISDERGLLLETGGGLKHAAGFFNQDRSPFLMVNVDVISDLDLRALYAAHRAAPANTLATLAVQERESTRSLLFNDAFELCAWLNEATDEVRFARKDSLTLHPFAFSGMQVISPELFDYFPADKQVFSIIDTYLSAAAKQPIVAFDHSGGWWMDVGKPEHLAQAEAFLSTI